MPAQTIHRSSRPAPTKKQKTDHKPRVFTSVEDIISILHNQNQDTLVQDLTVLRNQLSIKPGEGPISPQDARLLLAQRWLEKSPGGQDMFTLWDSLQPRQTSLQALVISILSALVILTSSHYTFQSLGHPILKTLFTPSYTRRLNSYIGGSNAELILVTLKLYNALSSFAGGREKKLVLEAFGWELKSLPKLLNMRRKSPSETTDALNKPGKFKKNFLNIRTLYILFLLSFILPESSTQVKTTFIEQHRDAFLSVFKGLLQDPHVVIRKLLEVCWVGLWEDQKIKRTTKISLFNEITISHLLKLYDRNAAEDDDPDHVPADLVHHFLLAICTRPGVGICFKDRGWYPRDNEGEADEEEAPTGKGGRVYNRILSNVVKTLKVNEDLRQQELALKMMAACPELVAGYWSGAALTLEPRLSSKWIANVSFLGNVISQPIPTSSFLLPSTPSSSTAGAGALYNPTPPPLSIIMENILPSAANTRAHFTRGLQSTSGLVQHCTALALAKCIGKFEEVTQALKSVEEGIGESDMEGEEGQWGRRRREVEREVRRRVPEFQVIVAFSQQKFDEVPSTAATKSTGKGAPTPNPTRAALLSECSHRLLWLYHRCIPHIAAEARFDVGKLLQGFIIEDEDVDDGEEEEVGREESADKRLHVVRQLHVLRLLKDSDQFAWSGKIGSGPTSQSSVSILLRAYVTSTIPALRTAVFDLLSHILGSSIMFQDDPQETHIWLLSLPNIRRANGTESPDGAALTDEGESVVMFLDDCIQRCMKTPYRYLEDLQVLDVKGVSEDQDVTMTATAGVDVLPSPLLMTVLEQFQIKVTKATLSPSEVLAVASFVRKLVFRLKGKQQDLKFLRKVEERFDQMLHVDKLFPNYPVITSAIRREVDLLRATFSPSTSSFEGVPTRVKEFLDAIEAMPVATKKKARVSSACELVDWIRLLDCQLGTEEIKRVVAIISKLYPPAISMILESLLPASGVWEGFNIPSIILEVQAHLPFEFLFLHAGAAQLVHDTSTEILAAAALSNLTDAKRAICHISHKLAREPTEDTVGLFLLLTRILNKASTALQPPDVTSLKETVFARSNVLGSYLISGSLPDTVREALHHFVHTTLDPANASDRALVTGPSSYWQEILMSGTVDNPTQIALASPWVSYLDMARLFTLFDSFASTTLTIGTAIVDVVLAAVKRAASSESGFEKELMQRLPQLLTLYTSNPSHLLEELIAIAIQGSLPVSHDGELHEKTLDELKLGSVLRQADSRWLRRLDHLPPKILGQAILNQKSWTSATLTICSSLLYSGHLSRNTFMTWLSTENSNSRTPEHLITVTHAFLDVAASTGDQINEDGAWKTVFTRILDWISDDELSEPIRSRGAHCVSLMMESMPPSVIKEFLAVLIQSVERLPVNSINPHLVLIGLHLHAHHRELAEEFIGKLVNHGIHWATRHFAKGVDTSCDMVIRNLTSLAHFASGLKSHLVETVLGAVIQNSLSQVVALEFVTALLPLVHLKPVVVNRHLQSILQHPSFYKYSGNLSPGNSSIRDAIVRLLYTLFHLHPSNTCQATHVEPLIRIYRGSLSKADGFILSIFRLFEKERKASISSLLCRWSPTPNLLSSSSLEALSGLDATIVLRTCLNFPMWRKIDDLTTENASMHDGQLYDPVFLMLAFAQMLAENPPQSAFAWVELFRTNIASLIIRALSSKDAAIRDVALCQLAGLWQYLENADLQERPHILHILTVLKDVIPPPSDDPPPRLPSYTTLLLSHALRGIFYPSNFIYPITARFLLQRPELDTHDVPMLYSMLYSSSDDCKKERGWIVRFLSDGMTSTDDWKVLKRRHTWDLLASLFQSCDGDRTFQASILEVLANITCNVQAATSLVLKCGLLSWIEIQVVTASHGLNGVEWAKILDNITAIVDPGKLEAATAGEWRVAICRCLAALLDDFKSSNSAAAFPLVVQTALRLTQIPGVPSINMTTLIDRLIKCLSVLETSIVLPQIPLDLPRSKTNSNCLHRSNSIHEGSNCEPLQSWGMCVEGLWRILMALEDKSESWDIVTSRILVWRAITGIVDGVPEWARRQVVCNMKYSRECSG